VSNGDLVIGLVRRLSVLGLVIAWIATGHVILLGAAGYCAFTDLLAELEHLTQAVRDIPRTSVNVIDQRTVRPIEGDEWRGN